MHVVATAGHVDHGKSTLVRALTGMEPDRYEEERRRGMTIDLGFVWTTLPGGEVVAFVDVPGHERFVPTMLAGVGPVPAVLLVVAADEGWMPQTAEHVAALDALGVRHGVIAVTRSDLADPEPVITDVRARLATTALAGLPAVPVSARTGAGLDDLVAALGELVRALPAPDVDAPVRLWIDRAFTIRGSGTVVTGTLDAGTLRTGIELTLHSASGPRRVRVRGLQSLGAASPQVRAVARVAVNLRGVEREDVARGDVLAAPDTVRPARAVDARLEVGDEELRMPPQAVLHLGSAAVGVRIRPLDTEDAGPIRYARLALERALPLAAGDVALLRDPGAHRIVARARVLDTDPPPLTRRGAARARAVELAGLSAGRPDGVALLARAGVLRAAVLRAVGAEVPPDAVAAGEFVLDPGAAARWRAGLAALVASVPAGHGEPGVPVAEARAALGVPDDAVVVGLTAPPLAVRNGRVVDTRRTPDLPPAVAAAVDALRADLADTPFSAPTADRLAELGLGRRELAAAERAGAVVRIAEGVVLLDDAPEQAAEVLAGLPQPFTTSEARQALGTSRRVAVPLLELLDRRQLTRRLPDDRRTVGPR
jgi:selenocysteine-specific elongation factor